MQEEVTVNQNQPPVAGESDAAGGWRRHLQTLRRWGAKGSLAALDQGLFSGANFLVNILLARWLPPEEYGAFAVALSVFYLLAGFHTAVLTEPMMVFGAGKYREHFRKYLGMLLWGHWGVSALISLALGGAALAAACYGSEALAQALAGLAIALPFLLLLWLTRRGCYVHLRPMWAVMGSGVNLLLTMAGLFLFWRQGLLSALTGLVLLGAVAGGAALINLLRLRPQVMGFVGNPTVEMVKTDHWNYGKFTLLESLSYSLSAHFIVILIPIFLGLSASANFAAVMNLYRPINLIAQSVTLLLLPTFSAWVKRNTPVRQLIKYALTVGLFLGAIIGFYGLLLFLTWDSIAQWLYNGKYINLSFLAGITGFSYMVSVVGYNMILVMKATLQLKDIPLVVGVSGIVTLALSVPLMVMFNLLGVVFSFILGKFIFICLITNRIKRVK